MSKLLRSSSSRSKSVLHAFRDFSTNLGILPGAGQHLNPTFPLVSTTASNVTLFHPSISFEDGNLVLKTGSSYFLVHQGVLCRASSVFAELVVKECYTETFYGHPVLILAEDVDSISHLLRAIYDGLTYEQYDSSDFMLLSTLLRLTTKYRIERLRAELLEDLATAWPTTLVEWDLREKRLSDCKAKNPTTTLLEATHPLLVANLAREINASQLLPAALYDLSRQLPSSVISGCVDLSGLQTCLLLDDILATLRGREHASRFLSTFIVNSLEGREVAADCLHLNEATLSRRRICCTAFEATTFELLKRNNGLTEESQADPLFAMAESFRMQNRQDLFAVHGVTDAEPYQACEVCRADLGITVARARQAFWRNLPEWFGITLGDWDVSL